MPNVLVVAAAAPLVVGVLAALYLFLQLQRRKGLQLPKPFTDELSVELPKHTYQLPKRALVSGGAGFLGSKLVETLLEHGCEVTVLDLKEPKATGVNFVRGNITNKGVCERACENVDIVFHAAAASVFGTEAEMWENNVVATRMLLEVAEAAGVKHFVFTSCTEVSASPTDETMMAEAADKSHVFISDFMRTKSVAEQDVLAANKEGFSTVVLRVDTLYGPNDPHFIVSLVNNAKHDKVPYVFGSGSNFKDFTFVGNAVHAHMLAAAQLAASKQPKCAGKAYFITDGKPVKYWDTVRFILNSLGYVEPTVHIPMFAALNLLIPIGRMLDRKFTLQEWQVVSTATTHTFSIDRAKADLGYAPLTSTSDGLQIMLQAFKFLRNNEAMRKYNIVDKPKGPFSREEVAMHNKPDDAWVIIDGKVYDITPFVDEHPGGPDNILKNAGGDATKGFKGPQHPVTVWDVIPRFYIGDLKA